MAYLTIVLPAYNEAAALHNGKLDRVLHWIAAQPFTCELLIINDGSQDDTAGLAAEFLAKVPNLDSRVITRPHAGKAAAILCGFSEAQGEVVLFSDMDQATPINEASKLLDLLDRQADVAIGSRGLVRAGAPVGRYVLSWGQMALRRVLIGLNLTDTQCGFKAVRREAALDILSHLQRYHPACQECIQGPSVTSGFDVEFLFVAQRLGYCIREAPVQWNYQETRRVRLVKDAWRGVLDLLTILLADLQGKYPRAKRKCLPANQ